MLDLIRQVITRWSEHEDIIVTGGDWNATCRPRVGYADSYGSTEVRLEEWGRQAGLACTTSSHVTWQSNNESSYAVLDSFFWRSKTDKMGLQDVESLFPPDPGFSAGPLLSSHQG